jgi:hypothetical protein
MRGTVVRAVAAGLALCGLVAGDDNLRGSGVEDVDRREAVYSVAGTRLLNGQASLIHVLAVGREGQNEARALLADLGAAEITEARLQASPTTATLPPARWILAGFARTTLPVVVEYNPANERVATEQSVRDALETWTDVPTSRLEFTFGGVTTACASLLGGPSQPQCPARSDGKNVVAWGTASPNILGVASGTPTEGDILLNRTLPLTDACPIDALDGYPLDAVVLHELGHMAGLDHANDSAQVMFAFVTGTTCSLQIGDREGVTVLYPEAQSNVSGVVRHAGTGTPISGAEIAVRGSAATVTSSDGSFAAALPRGVVYDATVTARTGTGLEPVALSLPVDDPNETLVIQLDGATPLVASATPVREGDVARFDVRLAAAVDVEVSVAYAIDQYAEPLLEGTLVFPPGTTEHELSVSVPEDTAVETGEIVRLTLREPVNASIATPELLLGVRDDDDVTPPVVRCDARAPTFRLTQLGAQVSATVADTESGPESERISAAVDTSRVGARSVVLTGRDRAGNARTVRCSYAVTYVFTGFLAPVDNPGVLNLADAGAAIPLRWQLTDARGRRVTNLTFSRVTTASLACGSRREDVLEETAIAGSGLVNRRDGSYQLAWKSPARLAGSCKTLRLDLGEGVVRTALFRFR